VLLPSIADASRVSLLVAEAVGKQAIAEGVAEIVDERVFQSTLHAYVWEPVYVPYERQNKTRAQAARQMTPSGMKRTVRLSTHRETLNEPQLSHRTNRSEFEYDDGNRDSTAMLRAREAVDPSDLRFTRARNDLSDAIIAVH